MKITAKTIAGFKLPDGKRDVIFFDDELPGFGLRLRAGGERLRRTWVAQYRAHGRTRRMKLGAFEKLTPEEARKAATKILAKVELGGDPQGEKDERRQKDVHSLRAVIGEYLAAKESAPEGSRRMRPRTLHEVRRYLTGPYFKPLHAMPIDRITRRDVAPRLLTITRESGSPTCARARATLSAMFVWAIGAGLTEANPMIGTNRPELPPSRERVLDDSELAAIWRACQVGDFTPIIRLLMLTGCRRQEVGGAKWEEFDLDRGIWTIPAARTKNGRTHVLPLPRAATDIIKAVPRRVGRDYLFGERAVGFTLWSVDKRALDNRLSGTVQPWRIHDLRRSCATGMADLGVAPHIIETILNHQSGHRAGVAGIYNRSSYEREVRTALALWADHVHTLVEGGERKVIAFERPAV
jgi:integrase